ncbi:hypothetical protein [Rhizobium hainanense]|uniref:hypothetical protein n=1 Tax=Rhizobium hainanense TaxID=52131 RepID=UPI00096A86F9|nr:hypothetical protein [Rhizobium hainanense]
MTEQNLTPLLLNALGKRIDDRTAIELAGSIGKKPFKNTTPANTVHLENRKIGLEGGATASIANRAIAANSSVPSKWDNRLPTPSRSLRASKAEVRC